MKTALLDSHKSLVEWVSQATGINSLGVKVRLRGNDLHILCEGSKPPARSSTLSDLLYALQKTDLDLLTSSEQPSIYQVFVYGRKKGEYRPQWCHRVHLNQLERHLEQVNQAVGDPEKPAPVGGKLIISNESLARRGDPHAIARYLSETLSLLGVSVQVKTKQYQPKNSHQPAVNRLWIFCHSSYSPDSSLLAEPVAQQLRQLKLAGYQDAIIVSQVRGEATFDWRLRVDLRPPEMMLKDWARWGDIQAITRLLRSILSELKLAIQVSLKESTLHIFCTPSEPSETAPAPDKQQCKRMISRLLEEIAPQGILAASVYGQKALDQQPVWIDWLTLPATQHPALAPLPFELARDGDEPAIIFLLERLLNLDLNWRLKTGGIRVLLLRKGDLLHIMCDAPVCPPKSQVANKVTQFLRQLKIPGVTGVRVYGRTAGNKEPFWYHGLDLLPRQVLLPEATPEFATTAEYVAELVTTENNQLVKIHDLTSSEVNNFVPGVTPDWTTTLITTAKKWLIETQIFTETSDSVPQNPDGQLLKVALVWGMLGLLLTVQTDWILNYIITLPTPTSPAVNNVSPSSPAQPPVLVSEAQESDKTVLLTNNYVKPTSENQGNPFNTSGFTQNEGQDRTLTANPLKEKANLAAMLLSARSPMPSFNSRQLNEQLALYKQRIARNAKAADVLIIGSSRALRGIDPVALSQALAHQGYANIEVFNLGINGATAQVVDFMVRQVLEPWELPQLILWADGSRAFNSNREDTTFNTITASQGYEQVLQKTLTANNNNESLTNSQNDTSQGQFSLKPNINNYQAANKLLNQGLAKFYISYQNRNQIQSFLHNKLLELPILKTTKLITLPTELQPDKLDTNTTPHAVDFDGFLAISDRFDPEKYYQNHPKVKGIYDNDYRDFQIEGEQNVALQNILQFTQARNIYLVFVNMPLTSDYLDPLRQKYEGEFQQHMLSLANNPNFIYRDFSQLWLRNNDYFSDPSHLNRFGAYAVSKKLANDPMIPWTTKQRAE